MQPALILKSMDCSTFLNNFEKKGPKENDFFKKIIRSVLSICYMHSFSVFKLSEKYQFRPVMLSKEGATLAIHYQPTPLLPSYRHRGPQKGQGLCMVPLKCLQSQCSRWAGLFYGPFYSGQQGWMLLSKNNLSQKDYSEESEIWVTSKTCQK